MNSKQASQFTIITSKKKDPIPKQTSQQREIQDECALDLPMAAKTNSQGRVGAQWTSVRRAAITKSGHAFLHWQISSGIQENGEGHQANEQEVALTRGRGFVCSSACPHAFGAQV